MPTPPARLRFGAARGRAPSGRRFYWLLVTPALAFMLGLYFFPLARVLWISVTEPAAGPGNYALLLTSGSVQRVLLVTARICVVATALTLLLGYVVAYAMVHAGGRHLRWMTFFVLLPLWISVLVRAFSWVTLLRSNGLVNQGLLALGVVSQPLPLLQALPHHDVVLLIEGEAPDRVQAPPDRRPVAQLAIEG